MPGDVGDSGGDPAAYSIRSLIVPMEKVDFNPISKKE
jgi:hypothetical protein